MVGSPEYDRAGVNDSGGWRRRAPGGALNLEDEWAYLATATFADSPAQTQARFQAAFGRGLASVWDEWRAWLSTF